MFETKISIADLYFAEICEYPFMLRSFPVCENKIDMWEQILLRISHRRVEMAVGEQQYYWKSCILFF